MDNDKITTVYNCCFREMFLRVGLKYPNEKFTSDKEWFRKKSWTEEEQNEFSKWMVGYLGKKLKWNKKDAQLQASMFILNYGWTTVRPLVIKGIRK